MNPTPPEQGPAGPEFGDLDEDAIEIYDRTVKIAVVADPASILKLGGFETDLAIRVTSVTVNRAERRADSVLLVGHDSDPAKWTAYLEAQTWPDPSKILSWQYKHAGIALRTKRETVLLVLYLKRGQYRTFPAGYRIKKGPLLTTSFQFGTILLWEHTDEIWSGRLPGLAPLLILCFKNPGAEVLKREREIIVQSELPAETKTELLAASAALGGIKFAAQVLRQVFETEAEMIKERGLVKEWLDESRTDEAREMLLRVIRARFGEAPAGVEAKVRTGNLEWCQAIVDRIAVASTLDELDW